MPDHNRDGSPYRHIQMMVLGVLVILLVAPVSLIAGLSNDACIDCHDEVSERFHNTSHGRFLKGEPSSCESCHGSAIEHINSGDPDHIINPARHDQFGGKELCMSCHDDHRMDEWSFTSHKAAGLTCADCHTVHVSGSEVAKKSSPELCYDCHSNVRAEIYMPSHHPIMEGLMSCLDCHGVHGETPAFALDDGSKELCYSCHAEKEGPFIYEHAPVNEDCMVCHSPHGTVANNLLKQSEPSLCLSCHPMHFHGTVVSVDGDFTTPQAPDRAGTSTPDSFKMGMLTKCTQCHTEIHGSDMPSQAITTGGAALTR